MVIIYKPPPKTIGRRFVYPNKSLLLSQPAQLLFDDSDLGFGVGFLLALLIDYGGGSSTHSCFSSISLLPPFIFLFSRPRSNKDIGINKYAVVIHHAMMISRYFFISAGVRRSRFLEAQDFIAVV